MTFETGQHQSLLRRCVPALVMVLVCQFLLGFAMHQHISADCEASSVVHSDYQQLDQHPDQVDVTPDRLVNALDGGSDLPAIFLVAVLLLAWILPRVSISPLYEISPPLPAQYASRPLTRAPPFA